MNVLVIDTSTATTVLGLQSNDQLFDHSSTPSHSHSRDILPAIDKLMRGAGIELAMLDAIVFGQGPGSFTGLRIAVGVVQGLGYGLKIPLVPVSSMAALAQQLALDNEQKGIAVALKARLEEVYFGAYVITDGIAESIALESVMDVSLLPRLDQPAIGSTDSQSSRCWLGIGDGWDFRSQLEASLAIEPIAIKRENVPNVKDLLSLGLKFLSRGQSVDPMNARPVYLREHVADKIKPNIRGAV